jgi:hypothetical protein
VIAFFQKPVREITAADIDQLATERFPEGFELEYKAMLPEKDGQPASWLSGKDEISPTARDKILAEVIAFANAQGGYLVIGVAETRDKPPRAETLVPLPRIGELARRIEDQVRTCVEPPIPRFEVYPVETAPGIGMGVIVIYCAGSSTAPHRSNVTNNAYIRRGTSSVRMTMLEIQEMAVNVAREHDRLPGLFSARRDMFKAWADVEDGAAFRVTAIPIRKFPDPGRLAGQIDHNQVFKRYRIHFDNRHTEMRVPLTANSARPILRGVRYYSDGFGGQVRIDQSQNGTVDLWFLSNYHSPHPRVPDEIMLEHLWVMAGCATVLEMLDRLRQIVHVPNAEYALEIEIRNVTKSGHHMRYAGPFSQHGMDNYIVSDGNILINEIPADDRARFDQVLTQIDTDIYDAIGVRATPRTVKVDWAGL